jgi:SAM-dependent methyltransferase
LETNAIRDGINQNCARLQNLTSEISPEFTSKIEEFIEEHQQLQTLLDKNIEKIHNIVNDVQNEINSLSTKFFQENYQLELQHADPNSVRNTRRIRNNDLFLQTITQRIYLHSNWKYPALEIGCRDGEWTKLLVASDPLYVADYFDEFLNSSINQFPALYQTRVKKYIIEDFIKIPNLPKNQFGLIFSYNFFNYLSLDSIKQFLIQSMEWLRPGGKIIFTYNNADFPAAAAYAENYFMTYVPKSMLLPMIESLGFEHIFSFDVEPAYSVIEFQKPGVLQSIKSGQTIGEIKYLSR